ncbi:MAG: hypothetical protein WAO02_06370 [Verrucomicrobiia bacterium]
MCPDRKPSSGRERFVAVDWHDSAWSPRIKVQSPVAATPCRLGLKPLPAPASHFAAFTLQYVHH